MVRLITASLVPALFISMSVSADARFNLDAGQPGEESGVGANSTSVHHLLETTERQELEAEIEALEAQVGILQQRTIALDAEIETLEQDRQALMGEYGEFMTDFGY